MVWRANDSPSCETLFFWWISFVGDRWVDEVAEGERRERVGGI